jgi:hypothetical protein
VLTVNTSIHDLICLVMIPADIPVAAYRRRLYHVE